MHLQFLFDTFEANADKIAVIQNDSYTSYSELISLIDETDKFLEEHTILPGDIIAVVSDFNPVSIALFLSLINNSNIIVPLSRKSPNIPEFLEISQSSKIIEVIGQEIVFREREVLVDHELLIELKQKGNPGLILFSSGSTGKSKASLHDFLPLLEKFKSPRTLLRTITFLLFDHIGGVNTLFYILSNAGTVITAEDRSPDNICKIIEKHEVELLPTSPTFLNLILISKAYERYNLSSLKLVTYGTEVMPEYTLRQINKILPDIKLKQTYGLSELGILRSKSRDNKSLWVKIGGEDYKTKIVDGILYIQAKTAMMGYLNAPSPFDEDGWFNTQDKVVQDGEWMKILGRETDIINVGGQKVYPAEVESVLLSMSNVLDVSVSGIKNPIMGQIVKAVFNLSDEEDSMNLKKRMRKFCIGKLDPFKIPAQIEITNKSQVSERFKRVR